MLADVQSSFYVDPQIWVICPEHNVTTIKNDFVWIQKNVNDILIAAVGIAVCLFNFFFTLFFLVLFYFFQMLQQGTVSSPKPQSPSMPLEY